MSGFPEYDRYDAVGLAELVASGEVTPVELVHAAIARAEAAAGLNAVIAPRFEEALRAAAGDLPPGPFRGVPWLLKDLVAESGHPATFGSVFFRNFVPDVTAGIVERHRDAGFVTLGRTNTPEFGLLPTTEPVLHGPTRNPWSPGHSAGGSSGGAAAAVAAGIVPMAHASDGGGSIRIPASCCGVFGLKVTRGRNPQRPSPNLEGLGINHCVSRTVRDSAALLDATAGPMPGDPWWAPPPDRPFRDEVGTDPGRLRIGFTTIDFRGDPVHPEVAAAIRDTAVLCADLGHEVAEARPAIAGDEFADAFMLLWATIPAGIDRLILEGITTRRAGRAARTILGARATLRLTAALEGRRAGLPAFEPFTRSLVKLAERHSPADVWHARTVLQRSAYALADFFTGFDLFLAPVLAEPPLPAGELAPDRPFDELVERLYRYVAFTPVANVAGVPAMSVPLHQSPSGLPIGSQFVAPFGAEAVLFRLAGRLEEARPWAGRRPPLPPS